MSAAIEKFNTEKKRVFFAAIMFDLIGCASYFVPGLAESIDVVWAPVAAILHFFILRGKLGAIGAAGTFVEELLPATDIIPSFLIMWWLKYVWKKTDTMKKFE